MSDAMNLIQQELQKGEQLQQSVPRQVGMFTIKTANETNAEAAARPDPRPLWQTLWYEGEVCCLFADSNVGKSIYAVQIGAQVCEMVHVIYFDFELSDKQFQLRYTDAETGSMFHFPDNLYRAEIDPCALSDDDFENKLIKNIEEVVLKTDAKVLIIDNLTYLCLNSEKGADAGALMQRLIFLKRKYGLSILVLAHTPKRNLYAPITQNDLAGSKRLFNFFDSVFSIGRSVKGTDVRYIKQLKVRYGAHTHDANNVIVCHIQKQNKMTKFVFDGYGKEADHLGSFTEVRAMQVQAAREMQAQGMSQRQIANELGISASTINRRLNDKSKEQ